jgi:SAM-dependent methyltransferase
LRGATFVLEECKRCGLIYQREVPNDFLAKKLYDEWINPKLALERHLNSDLEYHAAHAREVMTLIAFFNVGPSKLEFLDVGMGWGEWCLMARAFGCNTCGIELSQSRIEYAKSLGLNVISWDQLPDHHFDFINTEQVFEHINSPLETLRSLKKSLKSQGLIKISVPDGNDAKRGLEVSDWTAPKWETGTRNSNPVHPLEHMNCFNRRCIIKMAQIAGLQEVRIPVLLQYMYSTNWKPVVPMLKNMLRPLYFNVLRRGTYLFFRHEKDRPS